jgi:hypothetical protein
MRTRSESKSTTESRKEVDRKCLFGSLASALRVSSLPPSLSPPHLPLLSPLIELKRTWCEKQTGSGLRPNS